MKNISRADRCLVCKCDHKAPPLCILRSVEFNRYLAEKVTALELSGDATVDLVLAELLYRRSGRLFDPDGRQIVLDSDDPADVARWDKLFSEDQRRFINRYKERADGRFKNRLQEGLIYPVTMMALSLEIRDCRLSGRCAGP